MSKQTKKIIFLLLIMLKTLKAQRISQNPIQTAEVEKIAETENKKQLIKNFKNRFGQLKFKMQQRSAINSPQIPNRNFSNSVNRTSRENKESEVSYNSIQNIEFEKSYLLSKNLDDLKKNEIDELFIILKKYEKEGFFENREFSKKEWMSLYEYFEKMSLKDKKEICGILKKKKNNRIQVFDKDEKKLFELENKIKNKVLEIDELRKEEKINFEKKNQIRDEIVKRENYINEYLLMNERIFSFLENGQKNNDKIDDFHSPFSNVNFEPYNNGNYFPN